MLATEATALLHGRAAAEQAADTARTTFEEGAVAENLPTVEVPRAELEAGLGVLSAFAEKTGLVASNGEARRQIKGGGLKVNDAAVTDEKMTLSAEGPDARRRDQALARPQEARAAEAGVTLSVAAPYGKLEVHCSWRRSYLVGEEYGGTALRSSALRNSKILRRKPGAIIDIGLTRKVALPVGPTTS